jgi:hypothetical protein
VKSGDDGDRKIRCDKRNVFLNTKKRADLSATFKMD